MKSCRDTEARCKRKIRWNGVLDQVEEMNPHRAFLSGFIENKRILIKMLISILTFIPKIVSVSVLLCGLLHIASTVSLSIYFKPSWMELIFWIPFNLLANLLLEQKAALIALWDELCCEMNMNLLFWGLLKDSETLIVIIHLESCPSQDAGRLYYSHFLLFAWQIPEDGAKGL